MTTTGEPSLPNLAERLATVEQVLMLITDRQTNVDGLKQATDSLTDGVTGVERVLSKVNTAMADAAAARATAEHVKANSVGKVEHAKAIKDEATHAKRLAVDSVILSLVVIIGVVIGGYLFVQRENQRNAEARYTGCVARNAQQVAAAQKEQANSNYSAHIFAALKHDDPKLAKDIEQIPQPPTIVPPPAVVCVKP